MASIKEKLKNILSSNCSDLPLSLHIPDLPEFDSYDPYQAEIFRHRKQAGVNLGCLFILERWLCPTPLQSCVLSGWESELDFLRGCQSPAQAREALENHWQTYITSDDLGILASAGINTVRIPIGYWILGREYMEGPFKPFKGVYDAAFAYLLRLIHAAAKYRIGVLIDLHGAPGGQNNDTHCGISTHSAGLFKRSSNVSLALKALAKLASVLAPINNVVGLEVLNEPADHPNLEQFYLDAHKTIRRSSPNNIILPIYICDCFDPVKWSRFISQQPALLDFTVLDSHQYFCHSARDRSITASDHMDNIQQSLCKQLQNCGSHIRYNIVVGEWSAVLNDQSLKSVENPVATLREFSDTQLRVWASRCAGQFYWNYRTADDGYYWSFRYCQKNGIVPKWFTAGCIPDGNADQAVKEARQRQESCKTVAHDEHLRYWKFDDAVVAGVALFDEGFDTGFSVSMRFLETSRSRVGFISQLAHEYSIARFNGRQPSTSDKKGSNDVTWQYEHGFRQGVLAVDQVLLVMGAFG